MKKLKITEHDYIKANRKASREAEIENHTHPVGFQRVHKSKKVYDRKRSKAENSKALPYFFLLLSWEMVFRRVSIKSDVQLQKAFKNYFFANTANYFSYLCIDF